MTVTYKSLNMFPEILTPVLHKVMYDTSYNDANVIDMWLRENCKGYYYHSPRWMNEKFIQFEDEQDAVMFALKWL